MSSQLLSGALIILLSSPALSRQQTDHNASRPSGNQQPTTYYSTGTGDFHNTDFWNTAADGSGAPATYPTPDDDDYFIIQSGHTVTMSAGNVNAQGIMVEGALELSAAGLTLTLSDGQAGADLIVNGTYLDNGSSGNGTAFNTGATWTLGSNGTFIKTNNSSAAVYRDRYDGGMATIPATAHWILRYTGGGDPTFTSEGGTWYPHLTVESTSGHWDPMVSSSRFEGSADYPRIKGNLDVGGNGSGTVTLYTENTYSIAIDIFGDLIIRTGSTFTNNGAQAGTGASVAGDLELEGALDFGNGSGIPGRLLLDGWGAQTISGSGAVSLRWLILLKVDLSSAYLQRPLIVDNVLSLLYGFLHLGNYQLTLSPTASIGGGDLVSFVVTDGTGTLQQTLPPTVFKTFPVGPVAFKYLPILLGNQDVAPDDYRVRTEGLVYADGYSGPPITDKVVKCTWFVTSDDPASENLNVAVYWYSTEEGNAFDRDACYVSKYEGSWNSAPAGPAGGADPYNRDRTGITSLSAAGTPFAIASGGVLPVEWFDFRVKVVGAAALLEWTTLSERNNAGFSIERSGDDRPFESIGSVPGTGDSDVPQSYTFTDIRPEAGWNYYRIRQTDLDGSYSHSVVRALRFDGAAKPLRLWPIPAQDWVQADLGANDDADWTLLDLAGRRLRQGHWPEEAADRRISMDGLPPGGYLIEIRTARARFQGKILKQQAP